jgi:hypothetical protein
MDDALVGALISAAASVVAAMISTQSGNSRHAVAHAPRTKAAIQPWITGCSVVGVWSLASPSGIHTVLAHYNFVLIPVAMMALAWFRPIKPMIAASATLGLFAVNWVGWRMAHQGNGYQPNHTHLQIYLLLACGSALAVFLLSLSRFKGSKGGISTELEKLARLHQTGHLSDHEFARGKDLILGRRRTNWVRNQGRSRLARYSLPELDRLSTSRN